MESGPFLWTDEIVNESSPECQLHESVFFYPPLYSIMYARCGAAGTGPSRLQPICADDRAHREGGLEETRIYSWGLR